MILIIPDIHGRTFWKDAVKSVTDDTTIVFLGDYLDPYMYEYESKFTPLDSEDFIKRMEYKSKFMDEILRNTINNFKEIIELKKNRKNVILLLGNHDCTYRFSTDICDCRRDRANYKEICNLFEENKDLFQLAYETNINGKRYIFSHAGIHYEYALSCFGEKDDNDGELIPNTADNVVELFNESYNKETCGIIDSLGRVSYYRGGYYKDGSIVWADINEWVKDKNNYAYQVFGHTQLEHEIVTDKFACLDCREAFILTEDNGELLHLDSTPCEIKILEDDEDE